MKFSKIILLLFTTTIFAQSVCLEKQDCKTVNYEKFWGVDISGNAYFSTSNNLFKVTKEKVINYTNNKFGKITRVETFNILQTIVFYKNNNAFVLLDAQLNEIKQIVFADIICEFLKPASQNELWFYDSISQKIGLYNLNSEKYRFISNPLKVKIKQCYSDYNNLFFIDEFYNYFSIDKFGKIKSKEKVNEFDNISFSGQEYVFTYNKKLFYVNPSKLLNITIDNEEKLIENIFYSEGNLFIFTNYQFITYKIKIQ